MKEAVRTAGRQRPLVRVQWYPIDRTSQLFFEWPQLVVMIGVILVAGFLEPDGRLYGTHEQLGLPPCPAQEVFGIPCPSCGLTTSFAFMAHGRVAEAFASHYCGPVIFLAVLAYIALLAAFVIRKKRIEIHWPEWLPYSIVFGFMAFYLMSWAVRLLMLKS
jgi:hypothetical protein